MYAIQQGNIAKDLHGGIAGVHAKLYSAINADVKIMAIQNASLKDFKLRMKVIQPVKHSVSDMSTELYLRPNDIELVFLGHNMGNEIKDINYTLVGEPVF